MSAPLKEIKEEKTPFQIVLPRYLNERLREKKPGNLSLRRFIVVLLTNHPSLR